MTLHLSFHPLPGPTGKSFLPCSHTAGSSHWVGHLIHRENIFSDHHLPEEKLLAPKQKNVVSLKFPTRKHNSCYELRTFCLTCYMPHGKPETKEIWAKENSEILLLPFSMDFTKLSRQPGQMNQQSKHVQLLHLKHRCLILCLQGCQPEISVCLRNWGLTPAVFQTAKAAH